MASPQMLFTDGTETVTIDGTDGWLDADTPFSPATPTLKQRGITSIGSDGDEQDGADFDNVTESVSILLLGSTTTVRANVQKLIRLFDRARRYNRTGEYPVYVKFRPDSSEAWYRSQVMVGRAMYSKEILGAEWINSPTSSINVVVMLTRRFFWEADAESELLITTSIVDFIGTTGAKTITNHEDGSHQNWIDVPGGNVAGDVAVPIRLEMTNLTASSNIALIYAGREVTSTGAFITATLEGESATPLSNFADANASNGNYNRLLWAAAAETDIATWSFTDTALIAAQGRWMRILARFSATFSYADLYLRVKLVDAGVTIFQSEKQLMTASAVLQEIASLPLPPNYLAAGTGVTMVLQATRAGNGAGPIAITASTAVNPSVVTTTTAHGFASGQAVNIAGHLVNTAINGTWLITVTDATHFTVPVLGIGGGGGATGTAAPAAKLDLDYLQLFTLDGWRKYFPLSGSGIPQNTFLADEGIGGYLYTYGGGVKSQNWTADGAALELKPHPTYRQRLRLLWRRSDLAAPIADTLSVRCYYRPRRLTI